MAKTLEIPPNPPSKGGNRIRILSPPFKQGKTLILSPPFEGGLGGISPPKSNQTHRETP
jgi:hypothetical protein